LREGTEQPPPDEITRSAGTVIGGGVITARHWPAAHCCPVGQRTVAHESSMQLPVSGSHVCPRTHVLCGPQRETWHMPVAGLHTRLASHVTFVHGVLIEATHAPRSQRCPSGHMTPAQEGAHVPS
jgi:hypothetical protein